MSEVAGQGSSNNSSPGMEQATTNKRPLEDNTSEAIQSMSRSISPPISKRQKTVDVHPSPFRLTWIRDLCEQENKDALTLVDLLGDPLITACWNFNYLHDINFLMEAFDSDVRPYVQVHVVHGFWKRDDGHRLQLVEDALSFPNVQLHVAPMPEMFGTHHSKMLILFRRDDTAQVIIHTANMIAKDWTNMTNAVWISPMLPKIIVPSHETPSSENMTRGGGERFKFDLLNYLRSYDRMRPVCTNLVARLDEHDFASVKGSLVASVPGTHEAHEEPHGTHWGWDGLARSLQHVPCQGGKSDVVTQISSIATLGANDTWLRGTLFKALSRRKAAENSQPPLQPQFRVVFPTANEIRASLDGYESGRSIHTKIQSKQQDMQLKYLRPIFHHWAADEETKAAPEFRDAGRDRAAPHVKTYIRHHQDGTIDWALMTSANLSKQAWGDTAKPTGQFRIASWEIGVLVWPSLLKKDAIMKGCFKSDVPDAQEETARISAGRAVVGLRMPYSLPLRQYGAAEIPWVATMAHDEVDGLGQHWVI